MIIKWYGILQENGALDLVKLAQEGHDSCIFDVHPSCVEDVAQMIKGTDLNKLIQESLGVDMTVPMLIDVKILEAWK
jgi:CheY-specific phosphatase CheX